MGNRGKREFIQALPLMEVCSARLQRSAAAEKPRRAGSGSGSRCRNDERIRLVRFNRSASFVHTRSSAGFTIITSGLSFRYHTLPHRELSPRGATRRGRVAGLFFDQKKLAGFDVVKKTKDIHVPWRPARSSHASYVAM